jgi:hypothetical protein
MHTLLKRLLRRDRRAADKLARLLVELETAAQEDRVARARRARRAFLGAQQ